GKPATLFRHGVIRAPTSGSNGTSLALDNALISGHRGRLLDPRSYYHPQSRAFESLDALPDSDVRCRDLLQGHAPRLIVTASRIAVPAYINLGGRSYWVSRWIAAKPVVRGGGCLWLHVIRQLRPPSS